MTLPKRLAGITIDDNSFGTLHQSALSLLLAMLALVWCMWKVIGAFLFCKPLGKAVVGTIREGCNSLEVTMLGDTHERLRVLSMARSLRNSAACYWIHGIACTPVRHIIYIILWLLQAPMCTSSSNLKFVMTLGVGGRFALSGCGLANAF